MAVLSMVGWWGGWGDTAMGAGGVVLSPQPAPTSFHTVGAKGKKLGQAVKPPAVSWMELLPPPPSASELSHCAREEEEEEEVEDEEVAGG